MIDWFKPIDAYCERLGPEFWAEPFNALSNIFMILAGVCGFYLISQIKKPHIEPFSRRWIYLLSFAAILTGFGSFFFHTYANFITLWGDILPILFFMEIFLAFTLVQIFRWKWWSTSLALVVFFAIAVTLQLLLPKNLLNGSVTYVHGVFVLVLVLHALNYRVRLNPDDRHSICLMKRYAIAFGLFLLSLFFRTFDHAWCASFAMGTHFIWHILNGFLLFSLIEILIFDYKRDQRPGLV
ncbi:MAG: ceramidase domain-containing protein [Bdellovibrionota bacterium]